MFATTKMSREPPGFLVSSPPLPLYRLTVQQYQRMIETGVLGADDRVELLEGWIVEKMTQNPPHAAALDCAQELLRAVLPPEWYLREQKPIVTSDSQPEPDLAVVRGPASRYRQRHPRPRDVALVIEGADASLDDDRAYKGRLYALARIATYWIINFVEDQVEVYSHPKAGKTPGYRQRVDYGLDQSVPLTIGEKEVGSIAVRGLLARLENNS